MATTAHRHCWKRFHRLCFCDNYLEDHKKRQRHSKNRLIQLEEVKKIISLLKQDHDAIRNARGAEISVVASSSRVLEIASSLNIAVPNLDPLFTQVLFDKKGTLEDTQ